MGCYCVLRQKKSSYLKIIRRLSYKALFGVVFPVGLYSSELPTETVNIRIEEDPENILINNYSNSLHQNSNDVSKLINSTSTSQDSEATEIFNIEDIQIVPEDSEVPQAMAKYSKFNIQDFKKCT
ncbi:unnamed protein product [Psylliodes chrysocephalus]|uniref:Uncharacterized protein n=1 Tax=Psylliodes chrysocephalus TaxID=3402493 RepID=A0A9P0G5Y0_9CUCU|nr:unnamed protein product [Psylliodes chrysocephala]